MTECDKGPSSRLNKHAIRTLMYCSHYTEAFWSYGNDLHQQYGGISDYHFFVLLTVPIIVFGLPLIQQEDSPPDGDDEVK